MTILFDHPLSPFAQKVKIALLEKGIPFESRMPNLLAGDADEEFAAANPRREVPALIDGGKGVFDSTIILEYIEDRWPTPSLLADDPHDRARSRMIEEMCDTHYEAINWAIAEIQFFGRAKDDLAQQLLARASHQTAGANAWLERQLGDGPYFDGAKFGRGDLSAAPLVQSASQLGNDPQPGSKLAAWLDRIRERPSVKSTFDAAQEALMTGFALVGELIKSGNFVREYRDHRLEWMMRSGGAEVVLEGMRKRNIRFSHEIE